MDIIIREARYKVQLEFLEFFEARALHALHKYRIVNFMEIGKDIMPNFEDEPRPSEFREDIEGLDTYAFKEELMQVVDDIRKLRFLVKISDKIGERMDKLRQTIPLIRTARKIQEELEKEEAKEFIEKINKLELSMTAREKGKYPVVANQSNISAINADTTIPTPNSSYISATTPNQSYASCVTPSQSDVSYETEKEKISSSQAEKDDNSAFETSSLMSFKSL